MNKSSVEAKGTVPRKDSVPDYDHLFDENTKSSGRRVKGFLGKIFGMNKGTMVMSSLIYVVQAAPLWITPLITAGIINLVTEAFMSRLPWIQCVSLSAVRWHHKRWNRHSRPCH